VTHFQLILAIEEPCVPACNGAIHVMTILPADLLAIIHHNDHSSDGWQHRLAARLQSMDEADVVKLPYTDPTRQTYRRVMRWAREQTTEQVEAEIRRVIS